MKNENKQQRIGDWITTIILIAFFAIMIALIGNMVYQKMQNDKANKEASVTTSPESSVKISKDEDVYDCVIDPGVDTTKCATFFYAVDRNKKKYRMIVKSNDEMTELDDGDVEEDDDTLTLKSNNKQKSEYKFIKDGDYLLVNDMFLKGKAPKDFTKAFEAKYTLKNDNYKMELSFAKDGTYLEKKIMTGKNSDTYKKGDVVKENGTYESKDGYICRKSKDGDEKIPFYIYKGKLTNYYYKLRK